MTYRAAYAKQTAERGEMVLTHPDHAILPDDELVEEALAYARENFGEGYITAEDLVIGDWTE